MYKIGNINYFSPKNNTKIKYRLLSQKRQENFEVAFFSWVWCYLEAETPSLGSLLVVEATKTHN